MSSTSMTGRERILACIEGEPTDCLPFMPITMMFAADHIGAKYGEYATNYRVLVEGQIRTAEDYDFDYVSCISDPAREAADCGAAVRFFDDQPPALLESQALLADPATLAGFKMPDPLGGGRMTDRVHAAALLKERAGRDKLVEGWIEGPMAEAADLRGINTIMVDLMRQPAFVRDLFEFVVEMELRFAKAQVEAGVDIIGVGDAAASLVGPRLYNEFVWPYEKKLVDGLHALGTKGDPNRKATRLGTPVRLHICGNTTPILAGMGKLGCEIVDLDYPAGMDKARAAMGPEQVLLGNIDPVSVLQNSTPEDVRSAVAECHCQTGPHYIVGAGCEVPRRTPAANLRAMHDYARGAR